MVFSFFLDILFEKVFPMWKRQHWCLLLLFVCRVIILLWKLRVKNFSKIVAEAILDFRSEHSIQIRRTWRPIRGVKASRAKEVAGLSYRYS
ncbi:uncharacterized protein [Nicotiana sylvestris]|uniref:uncharacterized protein isoform X2 n=1 Tax=Nicotiana sylvestris TaxID=4096 RepID=UPI00388CD389